MQSHRGISWPSEAECQRLNRIIFETNKSPFGIASYNPNEPISDFVGRSEELANFNEQIRIVFNHKISRAVRLEGPAGVGKSTLFNFLKESIEIERRNENPRTHYLLRNSDIFSTYFQITGRIVEFSEIWKPMLNGLKAGFEKEIGYDISLPEYIIFNFVFRMFQEDNSALAEIIWEESEKPERLYQVQLKDIVDPLYNKGKQAVEKLQEYYSEKKRVLRQVFKAEINGMKYNLNRSDNKLIKNLFRVIDENDDYLDQIENASNALFRDSKELINFFNDLIRFYVCVTNNQPIMLIGIDEVAKADTQLKEDYYQNLGNLFVNLRNELNYILFVFISTTEDWADYDEVLDTKTDLKNQISDFIFRMVLTQLKVEEVVQVFKRRMDRFWNDYPSDRSVIVPYYPFSENMFNIIFRFNKRDLRKSIHFVRDIWIRYRNRRKIPKVESIFECMRITRSFARERFDPTKLRKYEWDIIKGSFNNPARFSTNSQRSSAIEKGLEYAWKCLYNENPPKITNVLNNPVIRTSSGNRRPDIYLEIHGNLGAEYRRNLEFQVKAYKRDSSIPLNHIKSSLELFNENFTDFIYFIITGKGLDLNAEEKIRELEYTYPNRILRPVLNDGQLNCLYLLALYEEITGKKLGNNPSEDITIAKTLLSTIVGQNIDQFIVNIENLSFRRATIETPRPTPPPTPPPSIPQTHPPSLDDFGETTTIGEQDSEVQTEVEKKSDWIIDNPSLESYKDEFCALCRYLKGRESGKFKFKFTVGTVEKNVIIKDASLSKVLFKNLVKHLKSINIIIPEKSSYKLTQQGEELYTKVKTSNYNY